MIDVLAYSSDAHVWTPGVRYAAELAACIGATLTGLHVAPPWPTREPRGAPASIVAELLACAQEDIHAALQAGARFDAWARTLGVDSTSWHVALGDPAEVLGLAGNWSDLIVIDRRIDDRDGTSDLICETLLAGYVCLAVPDNGYAMARFDRVMVAFDHSPSAVRALHAALPLLKCAQNVVLLTSEPAHVQDHVAAANAFDPAEWLRVRRVSVQTQRLVPNGGSLGQAILDASARNSADLIVCGVRGRLRLDECRLDPVAHHVLACSGIPAFMAS